VTSLTLVARGLEAKPMRTICLVLGLLAAGATLIGCADMTQDQQNSLGWALTGAALGNRAGNPALTADQRRASAALAGVANTMGQQAGARDVARAGRNETNIILNNGPQDSARGTARNEEPGAGPSFRKSEIFTANYWKDFNSDGIPNFPDEFVGLKSRFPKHEKITVFVSKVGTVGKLCKFEIYGPRGSVVYTCSETPSQDNMWHLGREVDLMEELLDKGGLGNYKALLCVDGTLVATCDFEVADSGTARPPSFDGCFRRGVAFGKKGDLDNAVVEYSKAIDLDPKHPFPYCNRGVCYYRKQAYDKAVQDFTRYIELFPKHASGFSWRGRAYFKTGKHYEALADFTRAIELKDLVSYINRSAVWRALAQGEKASGDLAKATELAWDSSASLNEIAWALSTAIDDEMRDGKRAVQFAERAVALTQRKEPMVLDTLAAAYAEAGRFDEAVVTVREAIALLKDEVLVVDLTARLRLFEAGKPYRR